MELPSVKKSVELQVFKAYRLRQFRNRLEKEIRKFNSFIDIDELTIISTDKQFKCVVSVIGKNSPDTEEIFYVHIKEEILFRGSEASCLKHFKALQLLGVFDGTSQQK